MTKIISIAGARPQFIKTGIMNAAMQKRTGVQHLIVHTGQHYDPDMSDRFFRELQIPAPAYSLNVNRLPHGAMTGRMLEKIEAVLLTEQPDLVTVYGDTNSTLAGALAAAKLHIPVAHVEAGLRSFDQHMPEEINRILTDRLSQLLFCPTLSAQQNLEAEGYARFPAQVYLSGDIMYDAALHFRELARNPFPFPPGFVLTTLHREELVQSEEKLSKMVAELNNLHQTVPVLFAAHPRTRAAIEGLQIPVGFRLTAPFGYLQMLQALEACSCVITDSGGLQKEAYFFRKPCITARSTTEWTELVDAGANRLWTQESAGLTSVYHDLLHSKPDFDRQPYGNGKSCERIVETMLAYLEKKKT